MRDSRFFNEKADETLRAAAASSTAVERTSYLQIAAAWRDLAVAAAEGKGTPVRDAQTLPLDALASPTR